MTNLKDLLAVFGDIDTLDFEHAGRVELLIDFGTMILSRTHVSAVGFAVTDEPDNGAVPNPHPDVIVIDLPGGDVRSACRAESWWGPALKGTSPQPCGVVSTRTAGDDVTMVLAVRLASRYGAVRIVAPTDVVADPEAWAVGLCALAETLSTRRLAAKRRQRQTFYRELVNVAAHDPSETSPLVCKLWHELSGAGWVWLWLYNEYTKRFELAAWKGKPPAPNFEPGDASAAAYTVDTSEVVMAHGDLTKWRKRHKNKEYKLHFTHDGCHSVVCVPLVFGVEDAEDDRSSTSPRIRGTVCLHYKKQHASPQQPVDSLLLMGSQCAQAIRNAFLEEQRQILVSLTQMAQRHLTHVSRRPAHVRARYLKELIELIKKELHFLTVSIFYRRPFEEKIECIASTGMKWPDGRPISQDRLFEVVYPSGAGRTGKCFQNGQPLTFDHKANDPDHAPVSIDVHPETGELVIGVAFHPILRQETGTGSPQVIGVIRCGGYHGQSGVDKTGLITFHPVQVQTLGFIAQQVGPMLQIFENNIRREQTISTVKHDLYNPLNMIRDTAERIARDWQTRREIGEYDLKNLGVSHVLATNLIGQLDAEPGAPEAYDPEPTRIVGDILGRVVNMLSHYADTSKGMTIDYDAEAIIKTIPILKVDRALIERVIHNLLVNAVKYGAPNTTIEITASSTLAGGIGRPTASSSTKTPPDGYFLSISNQGMGIEDRDEAFVGRLNFRSEKAKHAAHGVGLGVFIARRAMERHGGQLILESLRNPTTFTMFFPRRLSTHAGA